MSRRARRTHVAWLGDSDRTACGRRVDRVAIATSPLAASCEVCRDDVARYPATYRATHRPDIEPAR